MFKNVFCIYADNPGGYCRNKNVKRSLFGIGARCCIKYFNENKECVYFKKPHRPKYQPPPQIPKIVKKTNISIVMNELT